MAKRLNPRQTEQVREAIKTTQLVKRLQDSALGEIELTAQQIKAIEILLKKSVPDLKSIEVSGSQDNPIKHSITVEYVVSKNPNTRGV